ncbi:TetR/AcrR family transcriptional regulator [Sphingomonas sp.]|uniref:TetR/AcrR family transcriptional regulator n=1 Tax=Sphingomonas sp. TaxID=28214 RepID=UPI003D6D8FD7
MAKTEIKSKPGIKQSGDIKVAPLPVRLKPKPKRPPREERALLLRERILNAAVEVVGEHGYQNASVGRIAITADIAQGTIYLYFETRQHLFDELLPHAGQHMMAYIGERLHGAKTFIEVEERGIRAFFDYLSEHPGFYRLLNEAEFAAPLGHRKHFEQLVDHYVASMKRSSQQGRISEFDDDDMRAIAYTMMAARSYFYLGYVKYGEYQTPPEYVIETYMKLVRTSLE